MNNLHVITVATESKYYFPYLQDTCKKNGTNLQVLGYGEKWKGFNWRFKLIQEYLNTINKNDIVCVIDGYDVICTRNLSTLVDTFNSITEREKCKLIAGYDILKYSSIMNKIFVPLKFGKSKNTSLNAGTYISKAEDLKDIISVILKLNNDDKADDQILLTKYANTYNGDIYIDTKNELFLTLDNPFKEIDNIIKIEPDGIVYNNNKPYFLHGPGCTYLDNTLQKMGHNLNTKISKQLASDKYWFMLYSVYGDLLFFIILFVVLALLVFTILKLTNTI